MKSSRWSRGIDSKVTSPKIDGVVAGYMCIDFTGEPAYDTIDGAWSADAPFALIEGVCRTRGVNYIRVDTGIPNLRMQHIFEKNGYRKCGVVEFCGRRLAYDKLL